ncbi:hypothetical protein [Streptomyces mirabilis]|uniref:hypothetical protein n=1 Tax=Streptomyces mirabilis TaxID=68239 RepID=UPI0036D124CD
MSRKTRSAVLISATVASFLTALYLRLGSVLPHTPEGEAMRENLTVLAAIVTVVLIMIVAACNERS